MFLIAFLKRVGADYHRHFKDIRRERLFLSSVSFFLTFVLVRAVTYSIRAGVGPFHNLSAGGKHIHHLVTGILMLLLVGYLWLLRVGSGADTSSRWMSRVTAVLYGLAAALTLDEFALWLSLEDVYWARQGRVSVDAVVLFGALLSVGLWGRGFFEALLNEVLRMLKLEN